MDNDSLGNRMKGLEMVEAGRMLMPTLPIMIRLDGKGFSRWTKGLKRPYDTRLIDLMTATTKFLVEETNAVVAMHQSDEISLVLFHTDYKSEPLYNGRIQKLTSVLASMATAFFNSKVASYIPEKANKLAMFDCRVWNVPNLTEAANCLVWRELDATKNSISMAAQHYFSHKELQNKHGGEKQDMLMSVGVNWNDYPASFKKGNYIRKVTKITKFTADEINKLPLKHEARTNPDLVVERSVIEVLNIPPITKVTNREDVLFHGKDPITA